MEIFIAIFGSLTLLLYVAFDLPLRDPLGFYVKRLPSYMLLYLMGLLIALLFTRLKDLRRSHKDEQEIAWRITLEKFRDSYLRPHLMICDVRLVNCFALIIFFFINLKHLIPLLNQGLYDDILLRSDRLIFSGQTSGEWLQNLLGLRYAELLSSGYTLFYSYTMFSAFVFILQRNQSLTQEFFVSFIFLWFFTMFIVYYFPTLGPCFYVPEHFEKIPACKVTEIQTMLWDNKLFLDQFPKHEKGIYGISGFPSLHLAVPVLGAVYFGRFSKFLAWLSWLFVALTLITTLYFGWHYFLDDVGAFLLVFLVIMLTRFIFKNGLFQSKKGSGNLQ